MALECEVKYPLAHLAALRRRLPALGAELAAPRHFEANVLWDTPDQRLRGQGHILRLRQTGGQALLTHKQPSPGAVGVKTMVEWESGVADPEAMAGILAALGYCQSLRYEKVREVWRLESVLVCLDELPWGNYLELEGPPEALPSVAAILGLDPTTATTATYLDLHRAQQTRQGRSLDADCVFAHHVRARLLAELRG